MYVVLAAVSHSKRVEMGVKDTEMGSIYGKVNDKIMLLIIEIAFEKLFNTRNLRTSFKCYKCSMFVTLFLVLNVLRWMQRALR